MRRTIRLIVSEAQLSAIIGVTDEMSSMIGVGEDEDIIRIKWIRLIDRMLKKNGYKRDFK